MLQDLMIRLSILLMEQHLADLFIEYFSGLKQLLRCYKLLNYEII